ncbi:MAG: extracellular solute-binding protein [Pseudomonadota bacterium]
MIQDRRPAFLRSTATRRQFLKGVAAVALATGVQPFAWAAGRSGLHGLSVFGDLKYGPDFKHLDYVNPNAPRGGRFAFVPGSWGYNQNPQTYNTMNGFAAKGDGPIGIEVCFDSLLAGTADEPDSVYGLVAETIDVSEDTNVFTYRMRDGVTFHDGTKMTADDVVWSVETLTDTSQGHPTIGLSLKNFVGAKALDERTVQFTFDGNQSIIEPFSAASLPIFSKAYFADKDFAGNTMDPILGSGAYKVGNFKPGTFIEYDRVDTYWGRDLPINVGQGNFDTIRIEFYREHLVAFQAFTKGVLDFRLEDTAKNWAQKYDFDAVKTGKVIKTLFPSEKSAIMQAFFINSRRPQFSDAKTREAIGLAFDYEWINETYFFNAYARSHSNFATSTYEAVGKPVGDELALLEPYRDELDPRVFGEAIIPPISDGTGRDRKKLKRAAELLKEAGWERKDGVQVKPDGTRLTLEFMIRSATFERVLSPFIQSLEAIGVEASIRLVDPAQYQERLNNFDFDVLGRARRFSATPLTGFRQVFSSEAADIPASGNLSGVRMKVVDDLIEKVENAESREEMETAARALDRVLRAYFFTIPNWHIEDHRVAYWNKFSFPEGKKPDYGFPFLSTWWFDEEKAAKL